MKNRIKRVRRVQYPATGVKTDIETLLQRFVDSKSIRFEDFASLWREGNYSLIHLGRNGMREKREFLEEAFRIIFKFALPPYSLQVRVGALYSLYAMYHTQRLTCKVKVRVPLSCWSDIRELHQEVIVHQHLDVDYIIRKMLHDDVFEFVAYPTPLSIDDFYKNEDEGDDDDDEIVDDSEENLRSVEQNSLNKLLQEDNLGPLNAVHSKYHLLKCQLHATVGGDPNNPSSSLDLIQRDLVDSILQIAKTPEETVASPKQKRGRPRKDANSSSERASRIRKIKQRASSSKVHTESGALRYLNFPDNVHSEDTAAVAEEDLAASSNTNRKEENKNTKKKVASFSTKEYLELNTNDCNFGKSTSGSVKSAPKRQKRSKSQSSSSDSEYSDSALSDQDVIKGVISSVPPLAAKVSPNKRTPVRKAKKAASSLVRLAVKDDSDSIDEKDDDDDYDVEKDRIDLIKNSRSIRGALSQSQHFSLNDNDTPSSDSFPSTSKQVHKISKQSNDQSFETRQSSDRETDQSSSVIESCEERDLSDSSKSSSRRGRKRKTLPIPSDSASLKFKVGKNDMVALKPKENNHERPLLAKVLNVTSTSLKIVWYIGGYNKTWIAKGVADGNELKEHQDTVSRKRLLLNGFSLTSSNKLPGTIARTLQQLYFSIDQR